MWTKTSTRREGPQGVEEGVGAVDVGQDELAGVVDRPVDVGLGGEVDDGLDAGEEAADQVPVADVAEDEFVAGVVLDVLEVVEVPGIGQLVQVDDLRLLVAAEEEADEVAADEARPARDEDRSCRRGSVPCSWPFSRPQNPNPPRKSSVLPIVPRPSEKRTWTSGVAR